MPRHALHVSIVVVGMLAVTEPTVSLMTANRRYFQYRLLDELKQHRAARDAPALLASSIVDGGAFPRVPFRLRPRSARTGTAPRSYASTPKQALRPFAQPLDQGVCPV